MNSWLVDHDGVRVGLTFFLLGLAGGVLAVFLMVYTHQKYPEMANHGESNVISQFHKPSKKFS